MVSFASVHFLPKRKSRRLISFRVVADFKQIRASFTLRCLREKTKDSHYDHLYFGRNQPMEEKYRFTKKSGALSSGMFRRDTRHDFIRDDFLTASPGTCSKILPTSTILLDYDPADGNERNFSSSRFQENIRRSRIQDFLNVEAILLN